MDPFRNYDAYLERPYQDAADAAHAEEGAWQHRGIDPDDIQPPHKPGDSCPRCGEPHGLALSDEMLYCLNCDKDVDPDEQPTFDIADYARDLDEAAAEAEAEDRADRNRED
jgi:hypothetical protein